MKSKMPTRRGPTFALVLAVMVVASASVIAQNPTTAPTKGPIDYFTATAANVSGAGDAVKIDLLRWSTDAEREQLLSALTSQGEKEFLAALQKGPTLGYVWTSESAGYSVRYAFRAAMPDGSERVIIATDRRLGSWNPRLFVPTGSAAPTEYGFTVIELRLNRRGEGEGKTSLTAKVVADNTVKSIALENYTAAPVVLQGVKRQARGS